MIALGGGAVCSERVREALGRHIVVWLQVSAEEAWRRVEGSDRPLAQDRERFEALHAEREPIYARLADAILPSGDEEMVGAGAAVASRPARAPARDADGVGVAATRASTRLTSGDGLLARGLVATRGPPLLRHRLDGRRASTPTRSSRSRGWSRSSRASGRKTLAEAERVLRELAQLGMSRADHLVALGGGVVGDLAGFCAATYQRGVEVVQVPTTLVAQVDSAYGGKTGVDLPEAKNYVGAYHLPSAVLADTRTLATLPAGGDGGGLRRGREDGADRRRRRCGSAFAALGDLDPADLDDIVFACARTKLEVVAADERDAGRRAVLNLGPHRRSRDRGGHRIRALPPRRGGRARPAGGAPAVGTPDELRDEVARAARTPRPADARSTTRSTSTRCSRRRSATRSATRGRRRLRASRTPRRAARSASASTRTRVRAAVEELWR